MKNELIIIKDSELYVGTWDLAKGFGVEHRSLTRLIKKYEAEFLEFECNQPAIQLRPVIPKKGGPTFEEYLLNEGQSTYLITLLTNNEIVRKFKRFLTKEFFRQKKLLIRLIVQKQNAEWFEKRKSGKIERRVETDAIKEFVAYAKSQGSQNADKYYMIISKMENNALFNLELLKEKYPNLRDVVSGLGLDALKMADRIIAKCIKEKMYENVFYKEIFQYAKARVESFADSLGKIPIEIEFPLSIT